MFVFNLFADGVLPIGVGTEADPYQVASLDNLLWISTNSDSWDSNFIQTADIDATDTQTWNDGAGFMPIGNSEDSFSGIYDGFDNEIIGLYINRPSSNNQGLFTGIGNATIRNLGVVNANITGKEYIGILAGMIGGSDIINCYCSGSVAGEGRIGSLAGSALIFVNITNCCSLGSATGESRIGGLVGETLSPCMIENSFSETIVTGYGNEIGMMGGLVGSNGSDINACYSTGNVNGIAGVGGLVGADNGTITNCYSLSNVNGQSYIGGLVGGTHSNSTINNCYSVGSVSGSGDFIGGLVGNYIVEPSSVSNSFWNIETSGQISSAGGTGKTTAEMKDVATFTDVTTAGLTTAWDFAGTPNDDVNTEDIWNINVTDYDGYPFLQWQVLEVIPGVPANIDISVMHSSVTIAWDTVLGATSYKVFSCVNPHGPFTEDTEGTFNDDSWTAPIGTSMKYYYVQAVN